MFVTSAWRNRSVFNFVLFALLLFSMSLKAEDHDAGGSTSTDSVVTPGRESRTRPERPTLPSAPPANLRELAERAGRGTTPAKLGDAVEQLKKATNSRERSEAADAIARLLGPDVVKLYTFGSEVDVVAIARALGLDASLEKNPEQFAALKEALLRLKASPSPSVSPSPAAAASPSASASPSSTGDLSAPLRTSPGASPSAAPEPTVPPLPSVEPVPEAPVIPPFDPGALGQGQGFDPNQLFNPNNNLNNLNNLNNPNNNRNRGNRNRGNRNNVEDQNEKGGEAGQEQKAEEDKDKEDEQQTPSGEGGGGGGGPQYQKSDSKLNKAEIPKFQAPGEFKAPEAGPEPTIDAKLAEALRGGAGDTKYWERVNNTLDEISKTVSGRGDSAVQLMTERAKAFAPTSPRLPAATPAASGGSWSGNPNSIGSILQNLGKKLNTQGGSPPATSGAGTGNRAATTKRPTAR